MPKQKLSPSTPLTGISGQSVTVTEFWQWAYSDILMNTKRAVFAEFLVGSALGIITNEFDTVREEWAAYDLEYKGRPIEVKCSAKLQSWSQPKGLTNPVTFDIASKQVWNSQTGEHTQTSQRNSDCYVFCLYAETKDKSPTRILNMDKWEFYVVSRKTLDEKFGNQDGVALSKLQALCEAVNYNDLKKKVEDVLRMPKNNQSSQ